MGQCDVDAWLDLFLYGGLMGGKKQIDFTATVGFIMNHKGVRDMIELLKDLMKYLLTGVAGIWAEGTADQGLRDFFSGKCERHVGKAKRRFQILCFCVTVIVLPALVILGIHAFWCKNFLDGTVALLWAGGGILYLVVLKINRNRRK